MPASKFPDADNAAFAQAALIQHNQQAWDAMAAQDSPWSRPVSPDDIAAARRGELLPQLTPGPLRPHWLGDLTGARALCLASGGGQQAPLLAALGEAAGVAVTVFDLSEAQLARDRAVAQREGLQLRCVQGEMSDLSAFADASFDLVFHPISNHYVPDVRPVWQACARVLRPGGRLLASFYNPVLFIGDRDPQWQAQGLIRPCHRIPYADSRDLAPEALAAKKARGEALVHGHSLAELIGGQLAAGLLLADFQEDWQPQPRFLADRVMPTFLATLALKPAA